MEEQENSNNNSNNEELVTEPQEAEHNKIVVGDAGNSKRRLIDIVPKKAIFISAFVLVFIITILLGATFMFRQTLSNTTGSVEPGKSTDPDIAFLRSIKDEYQFTDIKLRSESENDSGCRSSSFAGTITTTCLKRLTWTYDGHEIFSDLENLASNKGLVLNQYYGDAGNSKYYYTSQKDRLVCFHFDEGNDKEGNLFTLVVLATETDDICKGSTSDTAQINDLSNIEISKYQEMDDYNPKYPYSFLFSNLGYNNNENTRIQLANEGWSIRRTTTAGRTVFEDYMEARPLLEVYKTNYSSITDYDTFLEDVKYMQDFAEDKGFDYLGIYN